MSAGVEAQARQLAGSGRVAEAAELLRQADDGSLSGDGARLLVQCLAQAGDLNAAYDRQRVLVPEDVAGADALGRAEALAAAQLAQMAQYYEDAAGLARALVQRDAGDVEAAALLSTLVLWLEGPDAARAALAGVIGRDDAPPAMLAQALAFSTDEDAALAARVEAAAGDARLDAQARADLWLALAQEAVRAGEADRAWELAERGNALAPPRPAQDWQGILARHLEIYRTTPAVAPVEGPRHVYLVGTPRSGQSLVQSVLAAAPGVDSLGERGALLQHVLFRTGEIARMSVAQRADLYRQLAVADAKGIARVAGDARMVVDKSPLHLAVAGSVARVHPGAAFGAVLRDPADVAMSIWLRSFPPIYDYANDMERIVAQLEFAMDAVEAWRAEGVDVRLFDHAALVRNPAEEARAVFDWLGLAWSVDYLAPEKRTQPVATFSAAQVRQAISPGVARGAAAYSERLAPFAERFELLRERKAKLLT